MRKLWLALALLALGGCSSQALGPSEGKPFALNPGYWAPTQADLSPDGAQ